MRGEIDAFREGFPDFLIYTGVAGIMLVCAIILYILLTPWRELALVKDQNMAAGVALAGAIIGLAIPIAASLATSTSLIGLVIWGVVALLLQLITYRITDLLLRDLPGRIRQDEVSAAIVLVAAKLASAMLLSAGLWDPNIRQLY